jgi:translation initiation factor 2 alpha subunit (eIF-2alpha)
MIQDLLVQILPQVLLLIITAILGFISVIFKNWWNAHKTLIEVQKQQVIQTIGIDKYNQDISIAKSIIHSIEEQARNFNWDGIIKHSKATELISKETGLTADQIFNIIKATVDEWNSNKATAAKDSSVKQ